VIAYSKREFTFAKNACFVLLAKSNIKQIEYNIAYKKTEKN